MSPRLQDRGINLNTGILAVTFIGAIVAGVRFTGPILSMPERSEKIEQSIKEVSAKVGTIESTQTFQADALKRLAEIAASGNTTSREVDRHTLEIAEIRRRLEKVESK